LQKQARAPAGTVHRQQDEVKKKRKETTTPKEKTPNSGEGRTGWLIENA